MCAGIRNGAEVLAREREDLISGCKGRVIVDFFCVLRVCADVGFYGVPTYCLERVICTS